MLSKPNKDNESAAGMTECRCIATVFRLNQLNAMTVQFAASWFKLRACAGALPANDGVCA
jgi:hypothetical protein